MEMGGDRDQRKFLEVLRLEERGGSWDFAQEFYTDVEEGEGNWEKKTYRKMYML